MTGDRQVTIVLTDRQDQNPREVTADLTPTPGLVVHAAYGTVGWSLTHLSSRRLVGWWPEGTLEEAAACATALGWLADWETSDLALLATRETAQEVLAHGGSISTGNPGEWRSLDPDTGQIVITDYRGGSE